MARGLSREGESRGLCGGTARGLVVQVKDQTGRGGVGVERAIGADQLRFGRGQLAPAVDDAADGAHALHLGGEGLEDVHAQLGGGAGAARWHLGVHGAAQCRVQQGGEPATVHCAHGVEVLWPGVPWKTTEPSPASIMRKSSVCAMVA